MEEFNRNELKNKKLEQFRPAKPIAPTALQHDDHDEDESTFFEKFKIIVPVIIVAIVCFVAYAWYTDKFAISKNSDDLPVIKASDDPLREKPEDPGGMKIVNRDKRVFDAISGKDTDKDIKSANILPAPEEPMDHEEVAKHEAINPEVINNIPQSQEVTKDHDATVPTAEINTETKSAVLSGNSEESAENKVAKVPLQQATEVTPAPKTQTPVAALAEVNSTAAVKNTVKETPAAPKVEEQPKEKVKAVTASDIKDVAPEKKTTPQKKTTKTDLGYRVQLGSYRSSGDAESSGKIIKKKFADLLGGLNEYVEKADLGEKGIFYRLQLSGFKSESDARKICQKLTEKKQGCFFVGK